MAMDVSKATVAFLRDGEVIPIPGHPGGEIRPLRGITGLNVSNVEIASSPRLTADGETVRGVRYGPHEVFVPFKIKAASTAELDQERERMMDLLAPDLGPVEIRVTNPGTGHKRSIIGILTDGFPDMDDSWNGRYQHLGLVFTCHDPWWLGEEKLVVLSIDPETKPFVSDDPDDWFFPVVLGDSVVQGRFTVNIGGAGEVWPSWRVVPPGKDLHITNGKDHIEVLGDIDDELLITTRPRRIIPDRWTDTPKRFRMFPLRPGKQTITVTMVEAAAASAVELVYRERFRSAL